MKAYGVYILQCSDQSYYTGVTNDIDRRYAEHMEGADKRAYTFNRRPLILVFYQSFIDVNAAIEVEKQIKKWSVAKKRTLIEGDFHLLSELSKKSFKDMQY